MQDFILEYYMWFKAFHIVCIICWMAGLFYLPRLFVYHAGVKVGSESSETFKVMEDKLLGIIMNPAMILSWVSGGLMLWGNPDLLSQGWIHVKLFALVLLTGAHHMYAKWAGDFHHDRNKHDHVFYRWMNEVPTVLMLIIVFMAVPKPF